MGKGPDALQWGWLRAWTLPALFLGAAGIPLAMADYGRRLAGYDEWLPLPLAMWVVLGGLLLSAVQRHQPAPPAWRVKAVAACAALGSLLVWPAYAFGVFVVVRPPTPDLVDLVGMAYAVLLGLHVLVIWGAAALVLRRRRRGSQG